MVVETTGILPTVITQLLVQTKTTNTRGLQYHTSANAELLMRVLTSQNGTPHNTNSAHQVMLATKNTVARQAPRGGHNLDFPDCAHTHTYEVVTYMVVLVPICYQED